MSSKSAPFSLFAFQDIITSVTGIMILVTLTLALELLQRTEGAPAEKTAEVVSQLEASVLDNQEQIQQLNQRLARGKDALARLAGFDQSQVRRQLEQLRKLNQQLDAEMEQFASEREDALRRKREIEGEKRRRASDPQTLQDLLARAEQRRQQIEKLRKSNRTIFNPTPGQAKTPWLVEVNAESFAVAQWGKSAPPQLFRSSSQLKSFLAGRDRGSEYFVLLVKPDGIENFARARHVFREAGFDVGFDLLAASQTAIDSQTGAAVE